MNKQGQMAKDTTASRTLGTTSRQQRRMTDFNWKKYDAAPPAQNWADDVEPSLPQRASTRSSRSQNWSRRRRDKPLPQQKEDPVPLQNSAPTVNKSVGVQKASTEVLRDEPMWDVGQYSTCVPEVSTYSANLDFSTYPALIDRVYTDMEGIDTKLRREMPFCMFQHACVSYLYACIIDHIRHCNKEARFNNEETPLTLIPDECNLPSAIVDYCKYMADSITADGDIVKANFPEIGIPQGPIAAAGNLPPVPPGSFGVVNAANHNVYECYMSPLVTRRLVEETLTQNTNHNYDAWSPLPARLAPDGLIATENLLGYVANVERLNTEGLNSLQGLQFPNGDDLPSRIGWCPQLMGRVFIICRKFTRYKMTSGIPDRTKKVSRPHVGRHL